MSTSNPYNSPSEPIHTHPTVYPTVARSMRIKSISPLAAGKLLGALYAGLALIVGLFLGIFTLIAGVAQGGEAIAGGVIGGLGMMFMLPIFYGIAGFVGGLLMAVFYNMAASFVGGMEFEIET